MLRRSIPLLLLAAGCGHVVGSAPGAAAPAAELRMSAVVVERGGWSDGVRIEVRALCDANACALAVHREAKDRAVLATRPRTVQLQVGPQSFELPVREVVDPGDAELFAAGRDVDHRFEAEITREQLEALGRGSSVTLVVQGASADVSDLAAAVRAAGLPPPPGG